MRLKIVDNNFHFSRFSTHFCIFWGMYVGHDTSLAYDNVGYRCFPWGGGEFKKAPLVDRVNEIIVLGTKYSRVAYGHMITDFFSPFLLIPEEIQHRAKILVPILRDGPEMLLQLGYNENQFIYLKEQSWLYANIVYTILDHAPASYFYANLSHTLHNKLIKAYHLEDIKPTNYFYCNRQYHARRYIQNMKEIIEEATKRFPDIKFINLTDILPSARDTATQWASAKLIFLPSGANTFKEVFIKPNNVVVMPTSRHGDYSPIQFAVANRLFVVQYTTCLDHFVGPGCPIDVNLSIINLERGIYCSKHGKWPSS